MTTSEEQDGLWTVRKILRWTWTFFTEKNIDDARRDAEILLCHALDINRVQLFIQHDRPLTTEERDAFRALVKRRAQREPVAYIVGTREFWSLSFKVDRRALIPRPDTEALVEQARSRAWEAVDHPRFHVHRPKDVVDLDQPYTAEEEPPAEPDPDAAAEPEVEPVPVAAPAPWTAPRRLRIADIGTGSGAIAIALASELPFADILATDLSPDALDLARENAEALGPFPHLTFARGDLLEPLRAAVRQSGPFDLILSNPPYIPEADLAALMPEVARHEPRMALTPGPLGTEALVRIAEGAWELLRPGGTVLCEIGYDQAEAATGVFKNAAPHWINIRTLRDPVSGQLRIVEAQRPA